MQAYHCTMHRFLFLRHCYSSPHTLAPGLETQSPTHTLHTSMSAWFGHRKRCSNMRHHNITKHPTPPAVTGVQHRRPAPAAAAAWLPPRCTLTKSPAAMAAGVLGHSIKKLHTCRSPTPTKSLAPAQAQLSPQLLLGATTTSSCCWAVHVHTAAGPPCPQSLLWQRPTHLAYCCSPPDSQACPKRLDTCIRPTSDLGPTAAPAAALAGVLPHTTSQAIRCSLPHSSMIVGSGCTSDSSAQEAHHSTHNRVSHNTAHGKRYGAVTGPCHANTHAGGSTLGPPRNGGGLHASSETALLVITMGAGMPATHTRELNIHAVDQLKPRQTDTHPKSGTNTNHVLDST
jgi:hypothetical protein